MATITIENVPESVVKEYWEKIAFKYHISFDKTSDELEWTQAEEQAYLQGKIDLQNWDVVNGKDFFNSLLHKNV
jgi:hypothetical protein